MLSFLIFLTFLFCSANHFLLCLCCLLILDTTAASFLKHTSIFESESKVPLPEDVQLQKLPILARAHKNLDWELIRQNRLTSKEEVRII